MRIGAVTGKGLAAVIRERYPKKILYPVVALVVVANTLNIGSDIGAMAASTQLLVPGLPFALLAVVFSIVMLLLEVSCALQDVRAHPEVAGNNAAGLPDHGLFGECSLGRCTARDDYPANQMEPGIPVYFGGNTRDHYFAVSVFLADERGSRR